MKLIDIQKLQEKAREYSREADQRAGAYGQLKQQLQTEFGCGTLKEARAKLDTLGKKKEELEFALEQMMEKFEEEFPGVLDDCT